MKRGFLNSSRYKQAVAADDGAKPASMPKRTCGDGAAIGDRDALDAGVRDSGATTDAGRKGKAKARVVDAGDDGMDTTPDEGDPTVQAKDKDPKGKCKRKAVDDDEEAMEKIIKSLGIEPERPPSFVDGPTISRVLPQRPGRGRNPEEIFLHTVPRSHGGPRKKRCIFRRWPRSPNGKLIVQRDKPKGKVSPDGYPWGATLYDLFAVNRAPPHFGIVSYMTGSALLEEMKELGELDPAAPEIEWAESEGGPKDEGVADTEELVICAESQTRFKVQEDDSDQEEEEEEEEEEEQEEEEQGGEEEQEEEEEEEEEEEQEEEEEEDEEEQEDEEEEEDEEQEDEDAEDAEVVERIVDPGPIPPPPKISNISPFHPSHYPKPWPFVPFGRSESRVLLQDRIPLYLLPRTLYVHDPFNLLSAREQTFRSTRWDSRPDIVRTYNLALSESVRKEAAEAKKRAEEVEEFKARTLIVLRYKQTKEQIENYEPTIEVPLPPYPRRLTTIEEAHLYISPAAKVGEGHHSVVYKGEWELPRDLCVRPTICAQCFKECADAEIQRLKDTGRWEKMLKTASWGPKGFTGYKPTEAELAAANDPINLEQNGETIEREMICVVPAGISPSQVLGLLDDKNIWDSFMKKKDLNTAVLDFANILDEDESTDDTLSPVVRIDPPFSYEDCAHRHRYSLPGGHGPSPRTTKFTVTVKLSLEYDSHLGQEANNYQQFPEHFFRHYNGYTIVSQLHAIVPVHALVPQFYGYYKPVEGYPPLRYLSPILLLEHCGQPIEPHTLSQEDQEECTSMLLRFQRGGWLHESVFPRNFLVQKGMPTEFPLMWMARPELSFRLIDFGRSRKWTSEGRGNDGTTRVFQIDR